MVANNFMPFWEMRPCSDCHHVTAPYKLSYYYCYAFGVYSFWFFLLD